MMTNVLRQRGIPHINKLNKYELDSFGEQFVADVTEKTDGMAFEVGFDTSFYTRTSHSQKMRNIGDYYQHAKAKFGDKCDPSISLRFDDIHKHMVTNKNLVDYLQTHQTSFSGEIFYVGAGRLLEGNRVMFVGTAYNIDELGKVGTFVIHSKANKMPDCKTIKSFDTDSFKFDDDDVGGLTINLPLQFRYESAVDLDRRVRDTLARVTPKWGDEVEGYVLHTTNPALPRVKVIREDWAQSRSRGL